MSDFINYSYFTNKWFYLWSHVPNVVEMKVHIQHIILWEFDNDKNFTETTKKFSSLYDQSDITDSKLQNCFHNWFLARRHWEMNPGQDARQTLIRMLFDASSNPGRDIAFHIALIPLGKVWI